VADADLQIVIECDTSAVQQALSDVQKQIEAFQGALSSVDPSALDTVQVALGGVSSSSETAATGLADTGSAAAGAYAELTDTANAAGDAGSALAGASSSATDASGALSDVGASAGGAFAELTDAANAAGSAGDGLAVAAASAADASSSLSDTMSAASEASGALSDAGTAGSDAGAGLSDAAGAAGDADTALAGTASSASWLDSAMAATAASASDTSAALSNAGAAASDAGAGLDQASSAAADATGNLSEAGSAGDEVGAGLSQASSAAGELAGGLGGLAPDLNVVTSAATDAVGALGDGPMGLATAAAVAVAAVSALGVVGANYATEMTRFEDISGASAIQASNLANAMSDVGVPMQSLITGTGMIARQMDAYRLAIESGKTVTSPFSLAMEQLGITMIDAGGHARPVVDVLNDIISRLAGVKNPADQANLAATLFSRGLAAQLLPAIKDWNQLLPIAADQTNKLNLSQADSDKMMRAYHTDLTNVSIELAKLGVTVFPVLDRMLQLVASGFQAGGNAIKSVKDNAIDPLIQTIGPAFNTATEAVAGFLAPVKALWDLMSEKDRAAVFAAIAATVVFWFGAIAVSAGVAFVAENAALLGIPLLVAGAVVALTLLVTHWDEVWAALQAAPQAILNWLQNNWKQALIIALTGPIGAVIIYWNDIWGAMPDGIKSVMGRIVNAVRDPLNQIIDMFNNMAREVVKPLNWIAEQMDKVTGQDWKISAPQAGYIGIMQTDFTQYSGTMDAFLEKNKQVKDSVDALVPSLDNVDTGLVDISGASDKATPALSAADQAFIALAGDLTAAGLTGAQFIAEVDLMNAAGKALGLTFAQMVDVFHASGLAVDEFNAHLQAVVSLDALKQKAEEATKSVSNLYSAMNAVLSAPTKESAAAQLAEDQLKLRKAQLEAEGAVATGKSAHDKELKAIDDQIAQMDKQNAVRAAGLQIEKDLLTVNDATLLTDKGQLAGAEQLITAMAGQSYGAAILQGQYYLSTLALAGWTDELKGWMDAAKGQQTQVGSSVQEQIDAWNRLTDLGKRYVIGLSQNAEPAQASVAAALQPFGPAAAPSFDTGGIVSSSGLAQLQQGEEVLTQAQQVAAGAWASQSQASSAPPSGFFHRETVTNSESKTTTVEKGPTYNLYAPLTLVVQGSEEDLLERLGREMR
jgi:hypothetical protein